MSTHEEMFTKCSPCPRNVYNVHKSACALIISGQEKDVQCAWRRNIFDNDRISIARLCENQLRISQDNIFQIHAGCSYTQIKSILQNAAQLKPDFLVVFYSGHFIQYDNELEFNVGDDQKELLCESRLRAWLTKISPKELFVIIDACYAAKFDILPRLDKNNNYKNMRPCLWQVVIYACHVDKYSLCECDRKNSIFTEQFDMVMKLEFKVSTSEEYDFIRNGNDMDYKSLCKLLKMQMKKMTKDDRLNLQLMPVIKNFGSISSPIISNFTATRDITVEGSIKFLYHCIESKLPYKFENNKFTNYCDENCDEDIRRDIRDVLVLKRKLNTETDYRIFQILIENSEQNEYADYIDVLTFDGLKKMAANAERVNIHVEIITNGSLLNLNKWVACFHSISTKEDDSFKIIKK